MSLDERAPVVLERAARRAPVPRRSPRPDRALVLLAPPALALVLGLWGIRRQNSMWGDETVTYQLARRDLAQIWRTAEHVDLVHAVYYSVMHGLFGLFGEGLLTLRLPSVLAMCAAASGVALLGLRLAGPPAGLSAGLVFTLLPQVQKYAQEGRSYALVCALVSWATVALLAGLAHRDRWRWVVYGATMLTACLLHEFAVLALAAHGATLLLARVPRPVLRAWSVSAAAVVTGLLPLVLLSAGQSQQVAWINGPVRILDFLPLAAAGVVGAKVVPLRARGPVRLAALAVPLVVLPCLLLLLASLVKPLFVDRYVLYGNIGTALLLGACLSHLHRRWWSSRTPRTTAVAVLAALAVLAVLVPASLALRTPESRSNDVTAVGAAIRHEGRPGDGLLYLPAQRRSWIGADPADTRAVTDLALKRDPAASNTLSGVEFSARDVAARMLRYDRIVVVRDPAGARPPATARERAKARTLRLHFHVRRSTLVDGARVTVFVRDGAPSAKPGS
ncbi:glycosyltransferase family 39 protein [Streptomyces griseoaurantiacus]|uniref:glycosyltransferase family 39 protein n=1 Tax=Streptomyces griseoaurantiacus TaxID=68213 RepID=UPI002E2ABABB|nr:glycosyltransferase family 39 protein [Streptomyces jietaisiensis]